ncbi:hypothetical protein EPUS_09082 [Endocarpon pusillum Z07020]|uniref:F-box domain-containing protein n=1 Tax=Endocarpon pusillum (strain Z07020 / HMAS-L-300199) TaxID=1263415 RepID=U1I4L3_ENDPU|nr:uncharacterized protein EPUS_09082 [Endocarpon pusillum Z07020]ERF77059.1 hypothetical protein EPUS_09082 [Endocarpon pusillum Z07020]
METPALPPVPPPGSTHLLGNSALENMPPELRIHILESLDFVSLRSLVRASPSYHATYLNVGREGVLSHIAVQQLDPRIRAHALAAVRSATFYETRRQLVEVKRTLTFFDDHNRARTDSADSSSGWLSFRSMAEVLDLIHLHETVKHLVFQYCLSITSIMPQGQQPFNLSQMEELRLHRAMYRFWVYCNFFGNNPPMFEQSLLPHGARDQHPRMRFLPSMPTWEVVEMACIWQYFYRLWAFVQPGSSKGRLGGCGNSRLYLLELAVRRRRGHGGSDENSAPGPSHDKANQAKPCDDQDERLGRYFTHVRPHFLSKIRWKESQNWAFRSGQDGRVTVCMPFDLHDPYPLDHFVHPADKYAHPDILARLPQMPESEQPSHGWKWFCHEYKVPALGVGPWAWQTVGKYIAVDEKGRELMWGCPFWDKERLDRRGVVTSSSCKEKKNENENENENEADESYGLGEDGCFLFGEDGS